MRVPRCCTTGRPSRRVRAGSCGAVELVRAVRSWRRAWSEQSTSRTAFHNALRGLEPCAHAVGSGFFPAGWNRSKPPLLTFALETKPSLTEFARDSHGSTEWGLPPVWSEPALRSPGEAFAAPCAGPAVSLPSLRCGGRHQPHLPAFARRVEKRPITHARSSVAVYAPRAVLTRLALHGGCHRGPIRRRDFSIFSGENVRSALQLP
jgi:hypothetical protein